MCNTFPLQQLKDLAVPGFESFHQVAAEFGVSKYISLVVEEQELLEKELMKQFEVSVCI